MIRREKRLPFRGKLSAKQTDEGRSAHYCPLPGCPAHLPLIRRCGATFPQRGEGKEIINRENHHVQPT